MNFAPKLDSYAHSSLARNSLSLILAFHSLLWMIDHHQKPMSLVGKPVVSLFKEFGFLVIVHANDDRQRLEFQNTAEHWKVFISSPKAQVVSINF